MAEGGRGVQKFVSKSLNKLHFRPTNMFSGSDSDDEYKEDDLYANFCVSEMFSDECDDYYEESVRRVERHFQNESESHDYEYDDVVADSPPSPGNSMAGKQKQNLAATASDQSVESGTGAGGGEPTLRFSRRSFDDDDDAVTDCLSPGRHGQDFGGTSSPADVAEFLKTHGDCFDPSPSPASSTWRPPGGAEGGPDDMQRYTRSEGDVNPRVRRTGVYGGPDDVQRYTRSEGSVHPRRPPPNFRAVAQHDRIVSTARKLAELGNAINKQYEEQIRAAELKEPSYLAHWKKLTSCIRTVTGAIDATATWVEHHSKVMMDNMKGMKDMQKQEGVLRGLFLLTDISRRVSSIAVVQMACQYLDAPDEAFEAQRNAVLRSLDQVGKEIDKISETVETASELLRQIIKLCDSEDRPQFQKITREFDNAVREANLAIRSCDQRLEKADKIIKDLLFKINSVRWFHRGLRFAGFGLTAYYFYGKYCDGAINRPTAILASGCSLVAWLAMLPTKTYEYYEQLSQLQYKHDEMRQQLKSLREKLHSAKEHKKSVTKR